MPFTSKYTAAPSDLPLRHDFSTPSVNFSQPALLLVEPDVELLSTRTRVLTNSGYCVAAAMTEREVFAFRGIEVRLAVLSNALGSSALRMVAESVRRQWPSARILILGIAVSELEDQLYDEAVDYRISLKDLLTALLKLSTNQSNQMPGVFEIDRHIANSLAARLPAHRSTPPESDPTKSAHRDWASAVDAKDIPAGVRSIQTALRTSPRSVSASTWLRTG